jgi:hypothetical protein
MRADLRWKTVAAEQPMKFFHGCAGKMRVPRKVARAIARRAQSDGDATMRAYRCQVCKGYHDGHIRRPLPSAAGSSTPRAIAAHGY